jgi:hypothetical protein
MARVQVGQGAIINVTVAGVEDLSDNIRKFSYARWPNLI